MEKQQEEVEHRQLRLLMGALAADLELNFDLVLMPRCSP